MALSVPVQTGIAEAIFVDPSCESCAVGRIPSWIFHRGVVVIAPPVLGVVEERARLEIGTVEGPTPVLGEERRTIDTQLSADGTLEGKVMLERRGYHAVDSMVHTRRWLPEQWRSSLEEGIRARDKTARLVEHAPQRCDKREATCELRYAYSIPAYATQDQGGLVVPFSYLSSAWDRVTTHAQRRHSVHVATASREEETMTFHLPPGFVAEELPSPASWHFPALDASFEVESKPGAVTVRRVVETHVGTWDREGYAEIKKALQAFAATRQQNFTLRHATP